MKSNLQHERQRFYSIWLHGSVRSTKSLQAQLCGSYGQLILAVTVISKIPGDERVFTLLISEIVLKVVGTDSR